MLVGLTFAGLLAQRLDARVQAFRRAESPTAAKPLPLGFIRAFAADLFWTRAHLAWERGDVDRMEHWCEQVTRMDPRPAYYWLNAARMIAYDGADLRAAQLAGGILVAEEARSRIDLAQATKALALLDRGLEAHPGDPALLIEAAHIHLHRRNDLARAAECYDRAVMHPESPPYAERIYAGLLWRLGRRVEGIQILERHLEKLKTSGDADALLLEGVVARLEAWRREPQASPRLP